MKLPVSCKAVAFPRSTNEVDPLKLSPVPFLPGTQVVLVSVPAGVPPVTLAVVGPAPSLNAYPATREPAGAATVSKKLPVRTTEPPIAVTVTVDVASGVAPVVKIVIVLVHGGPQDAGLNVAVAPAGKPEAEKLTGTALPEVNVVLSELVAEPD